MSKERKIIDLRMLDSAKAKTRDLVKQITRF